MLPMCLLKITLIITDACGIQAHPIMLSRCLLKIVLVRSDACIIQAYAIMSPRLFFKATFPEPMCMIIQAHSIMPPRFPSNGTLFRTNPCSIHELQIAPMSSFIVLLRCLLQSTLGQVIGSNIQFHIIILPRCPFKDSLVRTDVRCIHELQVESMSSFVVLPRCLLKSALSRADESSIQVHAIILPRYPLKRALVRTDA